VDDIFKAVRGDSYFSGTPFSDELKKYFTFQNRYIIRQLSDVDLDYLSESDVECLDESIALCKDKSFGELTEFSHGLAWQSTSPDRKMSVEDILREAGDSEEYVEYISRKLKTESCTL
ncbi:MAG: hypothetical protein PUE76_04900, partial [Bacteroides sp.]|nr:hypothetical protein [Bacteroides sp.]